MALIFRYQASVNCWLLQISCGERPSPVIIYRIMYAQQHQQNEQSLTLMKRFLENDALPVSHGEFIDTSQPTSWGLEGRADEILIMTESYHHY